MNILDLDHIKDVNLSNDLEVSSIVGGTGEYPFRVIYDPEILESILEDEELLKEVFPGEKPEKTIGVSGLKKIYGHNNVIVVH